MRRSYTETQDRRHECAGGVRRARTLMVSPAVEVVKEQFWALDLDSISGSTYVDGEMPEEIDRVDESDRVDETDRIDETEEEPEKFVENNCPLEDHSIKERLEANKEEMISNSDNNDVDTEVKTSPASEVESDGDSDCHVICDITTDSSYISVTKPAATPVHKPLKDLINKTNRLLYNIDSSRIKYKAGLSKKATALPSLHKKITTNTTINNTTNNHYIKNTPSHYTEEEY